MGSLGFQTPWGLEVFGPQTHTIQPHPQEVCMKQQFPLSTLGEKPGVRSSSSSSCRWRTSRHWRRHLFALTKNNSTGRLVDEASFKQARVVVWKLSIFCRLLVQVWSVNVWTTFSIFHKLWNSMPSFLLSRFTATKPSGGNIKRHLSSLKHLSSVFTNGFMSTVDVHRWIYSRYVSKQIHLLN